MPAPALTSLEQRLCANLAARGAALLADLERFVNIPTGHNHKPGLDDLRGLVTGRCESLGASTTRVPGDPRPDWLWDAAGENSATDSGRAPGGAIPPVAFCACKPVAAGKGRPIRILICSHLDTVFPPPPRGSFARLTLAPNRATARGPGVVDMKGGIVIALGALEALAEVGALGDIRWTYCFNSDEETGSYHSEGALRTLAREHDVGLCTEPALPNGGLAIERMGSGQFQIECQGRSAHVGRDFAHGVSAVTALAGAVMRAAEIADPEAGRIVSVGPLRGADATNIVPDRAFAWGNARFPSQQVAEEIGRRLDALMTEPDAMPRTIVRRSFNRAAKPVTPRVEALANLARECSLALGRELPFGSTGGVCDGNILQEEGLPTIDTLGVRGGGLHTHEEWIEIASLVDRAQMFALLLHRLAERGLK